MNLAVAGGCVAMNNCSSIISKNHQKRYALSSLLTLHGLQSFLTLWFALRSATPSYIFTRQKLQRLLKSDVIRLHVLLS
ncbi:hypothetical protein CUMW_082820 [Citrus unshiu]|nr:hypothetical protein CUMW_082820 [Citrus unshiu]